MPSDTPDSLDPSPDPLPDPVTFDDVERARDRIRDAIYVSPCAESERLSSRVDARVYPKLENLQRTGSFKERGAANKLRSLDDDQRRRGVVAASAGNHAQAVAYHGTRLGVDATIVMPEGTPLVKVTRTREYGAEVVLEGSDYDAAYEHALEISERDDRAFIHPFDDRAVIAGQGTIGLELLEQNPYLDAVICAVGGGGLISGLGAALKETNPKIEIIGVEPETLPSMKTALEHGAPIEIPEGQTIADGVAVRQVGELTFATAREYVDRIVTVSERAIANAILVMLEEEKTVAEGAGAASVAAILDGQLPELRDKRVAPIICGGNIDVNVISKIIDRGLAAAGRIFQIKLQIRDVPGTLAELLSLIGDLEANVLEVHHDRTFGDQSKLGMTHVELRLETRGPDHIETIRETLERKDYKILDCL